MKKRDKRDNRPLSIEVLATRRLKQWVRTYKEGRQPKAWCWNWAMKKVGKRKAKLIMEFISLDNTEFLKEVDNFARDNHFTSFDILALRRELIIDSAKVVEEQQKRDEQAQSVNNYSKHVADVYEEVYAQTPLCSSSYRPQINLPTHWYNSNEINIRNR
jgi:hypothetical protein